MCIVKKTEMSSTGEVIRNVGAAAVVGATVYAVYRTLQYPNEPIWATHAKRMQPAPTRGNGFTLPPSAIAQAGGSVPAVQKGRRDTGLKLPLENLRNGQWRSQQRDGFTAAYAQ